MTDQQTTIDKSSELKQAMGKEVVKNPKSTAFNSLLASMTQQIADAVPQHLTPERLIRVLRSAYSGNSKLQECEPITIIAAFMQSTQLGLEINTALGQAYLIPFKNNRNGKMEAQFQIGYQGLLSLAHRTKEYKSIIAHSVYLEDEFDYQYGSDPFVKHKPAKKRTGEPIYYYAIYKTITGGEGFVVMSQDDVQKHAKKYSQAYQKGYSSPWKTDFDAMAKKTCLKQVLKYAPKSIELDTALGQDGTIKSSVKEDMSTVPNEFDWGSLESAGPEGK